MPDFDHEPLTDPSRQIRLLQLPATRWGGGMHLQLSTWDLERAPPYSAISYTWGPAGYPTRSVTINGQNMEVRQKCRFALLQARSRCPGEYIWIDSICINQDDLSEKSVQVAMMFDIYRKAKRVLTCIGESSESSRRLTVYANLIGSIQARHKLFNGFTTLPEMPENATPNLPLTSILQGLGKEMMRQLNDDLVALAERGYWQRLWIVQEVAAGSRRVSILCGTDDISPTGLHLLLKHLNWLSYFRRGCSTLLEEAVKSAVQQHVSAQTLGTIFINYAEAKCSDPRDIIYGVLGLVDWRLSGLEPIKPDYTKSLWDLAVQLFQYENSSYMLKAFNITAQTPEMKELRYSRSLLIDKTRDALPPSQQAYCTHNKLLYDRALAVKIQANASGQVSVLRKDVAHENSRLHPSRSRVQRSTIAAWEDLCRQHEVPSTVIPKPLYVDGDMAALICANALPGDLMITALLDVCLVVRKSLQNDHAYDVIGQAVMLNGYRPAGRESSLWPSQEMINRLTEDPRCDSACFCSPMPTTPPASFWTNTRIRWTANDAILFLGQDLLANRDLRDVEGRLARLTTRTLLDAEGAVQMTRIVDLCATCKKLRLFREM